MESPSISQELDNELQTEVLSPSSSMADTIIKPISRTTVNFVMGKHRMAAAISSLDQQIHFIQVFISLIFSFIINRNGMIFVLMKYRTRLSFY